MAVKVRRRRRKGTPTAWKETIRDAMLPGDSPHGVSSGTPAERKRDAIKGAKQLAAMRAKQREQEALFPSQKDPTSDGDGPSGFLKNFLNRNDGGIAGKTRRF